MPDYVNAKSTSALPLTPKGNVQSEWLYEVFRTGLVHQYLPSKAAWTRRPSSANYWVRTNPPTLNIDRLAIGFLRGISLFEAEVAKDPDLRKNFGHYLTL